jgi:hypothetical protein
MHVRMMLKYIFENDWPAELFHGAFLLGTGKCFILM